MQRVAGSARLLGPEGDELHRHRRWRGGREPGQLQQHRDAGRVVLRAGGLRHGVQVGADHDVLGSPVEARPLGDQVHRPAAPDRHPQELPAGTGPSSDAPGSPDLEPSLHPVGRPGVAARGRLPRPDVDGQVSMSRSTRRASKRTGRGGAWRTGAAVGVLVDRPPGGRGSRAGVEHRPAGRCGVRRSPSIRQQPRGLRPGSPPPHPATLRPPRRTRSHNRGPDRSSACRDAARHSRRNLGGGG